MSSEVRAGVGTGTLVGEGGASGFLSPASPSFLSSPFPAAVPSPVLGADSFPSCSPLASGDLSISR